MSKEQSAPTASAGIRPESAGAAMNSSALSLPGAAAAELIGVSQSHFYQLLRTGRLPRPIRLGRSVRWLRAELEAWLAAGAPSRSRWESLRSQYLKAQ